MSTTNNRLTAVELQKLRQTDFTGKPGFVKAETLLAKEVGEVGLVLRRNVTGATERTRYDTKGTCRACRTGTYLYQPDRERGNGLTAIFVYPYCGSIGYYHPPRRESGVSTEQPIITTRLSELSKLSA